ncbi:MAG: thiamine pyrophosphate-dependent dehydrogenase E1 component subunit alpha [Paracoccaceae bacterium]|nr:thiamine pyrophosphate-dependent dehydrogenase E1 component subunit alpha [Paracoccaceae bacterium]MDE2915432.1 thiamine pyrophosphate-dependent dehydrogenase E1 component subunit alpha [Paracoccaceae bacterium]
MTETELAKETMATLPNLLPEPGTLLEMYRRMLLIRKAEEQLARDVKLGRTPGQVHCSDGQEAVSVGLCAHLDDNDRITSTHRGHGHFLAKGGDARVMFAEIYGKAEGICGGMGGSMHVADFSKGIIGANGIVGAGLAIATGAALASQLDRSDRVSVSFFGDGAANQGVLMECLNIAALWKLPVLFVCENNGFSEFSPFEAVTAGVIADRAAPFGMPNWRIDGNDVIEVWRTGAAAMDHVRSGCGPVFIEAHTYRYSGHFSAEAMILAKPYRSEDEIAEWRKRDPIMRFRTWLEDRTEVGTAELDRIAAKVDAEVSESVAFAESGTPPEPGTAAPLMFANGGA